MTFEEYETDKIALYREFCETVRRILESAVTAAGLPRPQSLQCRPKDPRRLKKRLEQIGALDACNIEILRRDISGARIIFYTNTDVARFHSSQLMRENFEIEKGGLRLHHPTKENNENQYRGEHYTIQLKDDRTRLTTLVLLDRSPTYHVTMNLESASSAVQASPASSGAPEMNFLLAQSKTSTIRF